MSKRLPSLNALRVFVAVARSGGVSRAAEELNLTHSAVSHQIRSLQSELGITLFEKHGRGLMLTEQARDYVRREDYIRGQSVIESKLDGLALKIENVQLRAVKGGE